MTTTRSQLVGRDRCVSLSFILFFFFLFPRASLSLPKSWPRVSRVEKGSQSFLPLCAPLSFPFPHHILTVGLYGESRARGSLEFSTNGERTNGRGESDVAFSAMTVDSRHPHRRYDAVRLAGALRFSFVSGRVKACLATSREFAGVRWKEG